MKLKDIFDVKTGNMTLNGSGVRINIAGKVFRIRSYRLCGIFTPDGEPMTVNRPEGSFKAKVDVIIEFESPGHLCLPLEDFRELKVHQDEDDWNDVADEIFNNQPPPEAPITS